MKQDVNGKLNAGLLWQKQLSTRKLFSQQIAFTFKEETSRVATFE
jgi:hypothetical protein